MKKKYEPPAIKDLGGVYEQAAGFSPGCVNGNSNAAGCGNGNSHTGGSHCGTGNTNVGGKCINGRFNRIGGCQTGTNHSPV